MSFSHRREVLFSEELGRYHSIPSELIGTDFIAANEIDLDWTVGRKCLSSPGLQNYSAEFYSGILYTKYKIYQKVREDG
jgi:hypothetical protein